MSNSPVSSANTPSAALPDGFTTIRASRPTLDLDELRKGSTFLPLPIRLRLILLDTAPERGSSGAIGALITSATFPEWEGEVAWIHLESDTKNLLDLDPVSGIEVILDLPKNHELSILIALNEKRYSPEEMILVTSQLLSQKAERGEAAKIDAAKKVYTTPAVVREEVLAVPAPAEPVVTAVEVPKAHPMPSVPSLQVTPPLGALVLDQPTAEEVTKP